MSTLTIDNLPNVSPVVTDVIAGIVSFTVRKAELAELKQFEAQHEGDVIHAMLDGHAIDIKFTSNLTQADVTAETVALEATYTAVE